MQEIKKTARKLWFKISQNFPKLIFIGKFCLFSRVRVFHYKENCVRFVWLLEYQKNIAKKIRMQHFKKYSSLMKWDFFFSRICLFHCEEIKSLEVDWEIDADHKNYYAIFPRFSQHSSPQKFFITYLIFQLNA